jgi:hypothetical protein
MPALKLTPDVLKSIGQFFFDGFSDEDTAFFHGLNPHTVSQIRRGTHYSAVRKAVLRQKQRYISLIRDGKGKGWARIAWFLERRYPKEFSRPEIQLSLAAGTITNNTLVVTAEVADAIISRSKRMTKEVDALLAAKRPGEDPKHERIEEEGDSVASR